MSSRFCGMKTTTCALLLSFFGPMVEGVNLVVKICYLTLKGLTESNLYLFLFFLLISFIPLIIYFFAIYGILDNQSIVLRRTCIILIIYIALSILAMIAFTLLLFFDKVLQDPKNTTGFIQFCVVFVIFNMYDIFSIFVINKARKDSKENPNPPLSSPGYLFYPE